eukprot:gene18320-21848_t
MSEAQHSSILERLIGRRALPPPSMQQSSLTSANKRNPSVLSRGGTGRLLALVGINTGFDSRPRRDLLRKTWMPHREHFDLLEQKLGIAIRFMIGHYRNANEGFDEKDWEIEREIEEFGDIIRMDHQEDYNQLSTKTKLFFAQFSVQFDAEFYVKVDDDIYVNLDALAAQLETLRGKSNVYMGCMKSGQVINDRRYKWFEPEWWRLGDSGNKYFRHATGQIYVLSHSLASYISVKMSAFENSNDRKALQGIVPGRLLHPGRPQDGGSRICSDLLRELETAPSSELQQVQAGENDVAQTTGGRCMCTQVAAQAAKPTEALRDLTVTITELEAAATLATVVQGEELQYFCRVRDLDSRRVRGRDLSGVMARHLDVDLRKGLPEAFRKRLLGVA